MQGSQSTAYMANASHTDMLARAGIWPTDKELKPPQPAIALRPMTYRLLGQAVTNGVPTARLAPWFRKLSRVLPSVLMKMFHLQPASWVIPLPDSAKWITATGCSAQTNRLCSQISLHNVQHLGHWCRCSALAHQAGGLESDLTTELLR